MDDQLLDGRGRGIGLGRAIGRGRGREPPGPGRRIFRREIQIITTSKTSMTETHKQIMPASKSVNFDSSISPAGGA